MILKKSDRSDREDWWIDGALWILGSLILVISAFSLRWRMDFDTPLLLYLGRLVEWGRVPYRDFFDVNLPGTYLANVLVLKIFGKSDFGVRLADLAILFAICGLVMAALWRLDRRVAGAGAFIFALLYLSFGSLFALQRDFLLLLPLAAAIWLFLSERAWRFGIREVGIGLSFGVIALIKPQACLAVPAFWAASWVSSGSDGSHWPGNRAGRRFILLTGLGFAIPVAIACAYLLGNGAWRPFLDIVLGYWPLFADLSGEQRVLAGLESRVMYRVHRFEEEIGKLLLLMPALYGAWIGWEVGRSRPRVRRAVVLFIGLAIAGAVSVALVGRFWSYHWLPCWFALCVLSGFSLLPHNARARSQLLLAIFVLQLVLPFLPRLYGDLRFGHVTAPKGGRVDEIADFLRANARPGDTAQPLDWTEGSLNAMLATNIEVATSFVYTYQFHHHVSSRVIQDLRRRFMAELQSRRPRFIIETHSIWWIVRGPDTSSEFPELRTLMEQDYTARLKGAGYTLYERTASPDG